MYFLYNIYKYFTKLLRSSILLLVLIREKVMCKGSYECSHGTPAEYQPSEEAKNAMEEAIGELSKNPGSVQPIGRRFFGTQRYAMMGWYHDEENSRLVELCVSYIDRGRIANYLLNPHRSRQTVRTVSVAHVGLDHPEGATPYRLFMYHAQTNSLDTCSYDDYQADRLAVPTLGGSELMRESYDEAVRLGEDIVTPEQEGDLINSLRLGGQLGWRVEYSDQC